MIEMTVSSGTVSSISTIFASSSLLASGLFLIVNFSTIRVIEMASLSETFSTKLTVDSTFSGLAKYVVLYMLEWTSRVLLSAIISISTNFVGAFHIKG
jgi:hypothetical protein